MTALDIVHLRELLACKEGRHWYPRNRSISLVPDNSGMGATLPTNYVANFVDKETCELAAEAVNALPALLAIAEAAIAYIDAHNADEDYNVNREYNASVALAAAVDAARKDQP